MNASQSNFMTP